MDGPSRLQDLDITREELDRIGLALKDEEFRKLFADYIEEITDPENQKLYEKEITQLEKERGMDVVFVHPKPGYVIKTSIAGEKKAFINICYNDLMKVPKCESAQRDNKRGAAWSIPYSLSEPREDYDKKYKRCLIYDVVFHSTTLVFASRNDKFKKMVCDTACEAVENTFKVQLDKKNLKFPKLQYKGTPRPTVIRKAIPGAKPNPEDVEFYEQIYPTKPQKVKAPKKISPCVKLPKPDHTPYTSPKYSIKHRHGIDLHEFTDDPQAKLLATVPAQLIVEVMLPLLNSSATLKLDVTESTISLISETPSKYKLDLTLPYPVKEEEGMARFDRDLHILVITLPVEVDFFRAPLSVLQDDNYSSIRKDVEYDEYENAEFSSSTTDQGYNATPEENTADELVTSNHKIAEIDGIVSTQKEYAEVPDYETDFFLEPNSTYNLPAFKAYLAKNILTLALDIKNAVSDSLCHRAENNFFRLKCSSIGSGYFTVHFAICLKMNADMSNVKTDIWNNHVTVEFTLGHEQIPPFFEAGVDEYNLEIYDMPEDKSFSDSSGGSCDTDSDDSIRNIVESFNLDNNPKEVLSEPEVDLFNKNVLSEIPRSRSLDHAYSAITMPRSILKAESSIESNPKNNSFETDDSTEVEKKLIDEENAVQIDEEHSSKLKKTVKFKEVVLKNVFSSNSRIVGQTNKNQRKRRSKKRVQERKIAEKAEIADNAKKELMNEKKQESSEFIDQIEALRGLTEISGDSRESGDYIDFKSDLILKLNM